MARWVRGRTATAGPRRTWPTAPQNLTAATGNAIGKVDTAWQAPLDTGGYPVTGYTLQRSTDGGATWPTTFNLGVVLSYPDTACGASVICTYRVAAVTAVGQGPWSNLASAEGANVPSAPPNLTATHRSLARLREHRVADPDRQRRPRDHRLRAPALDRRWRYVADVLQPRRGAQLHRHRVRGVGGVHLPRPARSTPWVTARFSNTAAAYGAAPPGAPTGLDRDDPDAERQLRHAEPRQGRPLLDRAGAVNGAPAVTGYEYRYQTRTLPGGSFGAFTAWTTTGTGTGTSFSPTCDAAYADLTDLECRYEVRALNAIGTGVASNQATARRVGGSRGPDGHAHQPARRVVLERRHRADQRHRRHRGG